MIDGRALAEAEGWGLPFPVGEYRDQCGEGRSPAGPSLRLVSIQHHLPDGLRHDLVLPDQSRQRSRPCRIRADPPLRSSLP